MRPPAGVGAGRRAALGPPGLLDFVRCRQWLAGEECVAGAAALRLGTKALAWRADRQRMSPGWRQAIVASWRVTATVWIASVSTALIGNTGG